MRDESIKAINDLIIVLQNELKDIPKEASVLQNISLGKIQILEELKKELYIKGIE